MNKKDDIIFGTRVAHNNKTKETVTITVESGEISIDGTAILQMPSKDRTDDLLITALEHCLEGDRKSTDLFNLFPIKLRTEEYCKLAIRKSIHAINHLPIINSDIIGTILSSCHNENDFNVLKNCTNPKLHAEILKAKYFEPLEYIQSIPQNIIDKMIAGLAVTQNVKCIRHIPQNVQTTGLLITAISIKGSEVLGYENINPQIINNMVYKLAVAKDANAIKFIPSSKITPELCLRAITCFPKESKSISELLPNEIKNGDNLYTFGIKFLSSFGHQSCDDLIKLYFGKTVKLKKISTYSGILANRIVKYNDSEKKIICTLDNKLVNGKHKAQISYKF